MMEDRLSKADGSVQIPDLDSLIPLPEVKGADSCARALSGLSRSEPPESRPAGQESSSSKYSKFMVDMLRTSCFDHKMSHEKLHANSQLRTTAAMFGHRPPYRAWPPSAKIMEMS